MFTIQDLLGFVWTLPNSILGWIFLTILYLCKQIDEVEIRRGLVFCWDINNNSWFYKKALRDNDWGGFCIGNNIVLMDRYPIDKYGRTYSHEREHVEQSYNLGPFFYPAYVLESLRIYLFFKDLHSYYDNTFEINARLAAGQEVYIPKSQWADPGDRWIWW